LDFLQFPYTAINGPRRQPRLPNNRRNHTSFAVLVKVLIGSSDYPPSLIKGN
jgi:hypothetical protein